MKIKNLILLMTSAVAVSSLTSCNDEPYVITAEEEYTRNFIKAFGLIDPKQDWNLAQSTAVTVKVGDKPAEVKAYMKVDDTYYLVANLNGVSGDVKIPFDMPEGTTDVMVKINGKRYYTSPGATLDPNAPSSRNVTEYKGAGSIDTETGLGESGTYGGVTVTIQENEHGRYLTLQPETMTEVLTTLEENGSEITSWSQSNMDKEGVYDNFSATAKEFYLFPEYWQTSESGENIIGCYWEVPEGTDGAENVKVTDPDGTEHSYWIVRVPILQNPSKFVTPCKTSATTYENFTDVLDWDEIFAALMSKYPERNKISDGTIVNQYGATIAEGKKVHLYSDGKYREIGSTRDADYADLNHEVSNDIHSIYPAYYVHSWGVLAFDELVDDPYSGDAPGTSLVTNAEYYKSKGIHVVLDDFHKVGFYIQQYDKVMYSQTKLNEWCTKLNEDGKEETRQPSYTATFVKGTDTEGNDKRHLCFEDWYENNWDLNDMVFRVYGFDYIKNPEKPITTGKVENEDKPGSNDPTPPTPPTPEVDKPYDWLLAVEDLGATDDFDFNDIIIGITAELVVNPDLTGARTLGKAVPNATQSDVSGDLWTEVKFTALAAGGTLPAYVYFGETQLYPDGHSDRAEWHKWFGNGTLGSGTMINTNHGVDNQEGATCTLYFGVDDSGDYLFTVEKLGMNGKNNSTDAKNSGFKIGIDKAAATSDYISPDYFTKGEDGYFVKPSNPGSAPQMFLIPDRWNKDKDNTGLSTYDSSKWQWPTERTHIQASYSRFGDWVKNAESASDWYKDKGSNVCRPTKK